MFCNSCGYSNTETGLNCAACGYELQAEPHISDVTSGDVASCDICGSLNIHGSNFCRFCGKKLNPTPFAVPAPALAGTLQGAAPAEDAYGNKQAAFMPIPEKHESLLEKLDRMEREFATLKTEALPPEPDQEGIPQLDPQQLDAQLDAHEETLKTIAFTLDTLITDLLEAEAREYAFPEFIHPDETGFPLNDIPQTDDAPEEKKGRNLQEVIAVIALVSAIFLVGMTFGLWGSYFFGF